MSEFLIFAIGAVMFIITTGATVTFGLYRVHELQVLDMASSDRIAEIENRGLTEIYRTDSIEDEAPRGANATR